MKADKNMFPYELSNSNGHITVYTGLNVRDYIAIQAMQGFCSNPNLAIKEFENVPEMAYKLADKMIEESEKK